MKGSGIEEEGNIFSKQQFHQFYLMVLYNFLYNPVCVLFAGFCYRGITVSCGTLICGIPLSLSAFILPHSRPP